MKYKPMKLDFRTVLILVLTVAVIVLVLFQGCGDRPSGNGIEVEINFDSIERVIKSQLPPPDTIVIEPETIIRWLPSATVVDTVYVSGETKYIYNDAPSDYGQNDVGVDAYVRAAGGFPGLVGVGASASGANSNAVLVQPSSTGGFYKVNTTGFPSYSATTNKGLQSAQRDNASTNAAYVRGILAASNSSASVTPTTNIFYGLANNTGTTSERNYTNEVAMVASRCSFTTTEMQDWNECWEYYQTNIITGGRNV